MAKPKAKIDPPRLSRPTVPLAVARELLSCSMGTVYNLMKDRKIAWTKVGCRRHIFVDSIERMLAENAVEAR